MSAPVLVGALVDAKSLQIGAQGMALGVCGSAAVYAMAAVPSECLSAATRDEGLDDKKETNRGGRAAGENE